MRINLHENGPAHYTETVGTPAPADKATSIASNATASQTHAVGEITILLSAFRNGNPEAASDLMSRMQSTLWKIAAHLMTGERTGHTLRPSDLVQTASLKILKSDLAKCQDKAHVLRVVTRAMRQILIDHARGWLARKRGSGAELVFLDENRLSPMERPALFLALDESLDQLGEIDPRMVQIVELRFFAGLTAEETAKLLGISRTTVKTEWLHARAWLHGHLEKVIA